MQAENYAVSKVFFSSCNIAYGRYEKETYIPNPCPSGQAGLRSRNFANSCHKKRKYKSATQPAMPLILSLVSK
jgi:hypothetical protein